MVEKERPQNCGLQVGTVHNGLDTLLGVWHEKMLALLAFGAMKGWLTPGVEKGAYVIEKLSTRDVGSTQDGDKPSVAQGNAAAQKLRDTCKGTAHLVAASLADESLHFDCGLPRFCGTPFNQWHSQLHHDLRVEGYVVKTTTPCTN